MRIGRFLLSSLCLLSPCLSWAQEEVGAMVIDSATMLPIADVNVRIKGTQRVVATDVRGYFRIDAADGDTLMFSRVGYRPREAAVKQLRSAPVVFMKEQRTLLKPIEIKAHERPAWLPPIPPESPWKNPTQDQRTLNTPGIVNVQTFGPGYVWKGVFSRHSKSEREKRRLKELQTQRSDPGYVDLVNSPEMKGHILKKYGISEDEFYRLLALFNEKNNVMDLMERPGLVSLLLAFFDDALGD